MSQAERIEQLRTRVAPLVMTNESFRSAGHELVDRIAEFLSSIQTFPVTPAESPRDVRAALAAEQVRPGGIQREQLEAALALPPAGRADQLHSPRSFFAAVCG